MPSIQYHTILATYLAAQPHFFDGEAQKKPRIRKCMELPYQQTRAELWEEATDTLIDLNFFIAKTSAKKTLDLISDYNNLLIIHPDNQDFIGTENLYTEKLNKCSIDYLKFKNKVISDFEIMESLDVKNETQKPLLYNKLNILKSMSQFLSSEISSISKYGTLGSFICQLAYNQNDDILRNAVFSYRNRLIQNGCLFFEINKIYNKDKINIPVKYRIRFVREYDQDLKYIITDFMVNFNFIQAFLASENYLQRWNIKNSYLEKEYQIIEEPIRSFCLSHDSSTGIFITGNHNADIFTLIIYSLENERIILKSTYNEVIVATGITADGKFGFAQFSDRIIIWDVWNRQKVRELYLSETVKYRIKRFFFISNTEFLLFDNSGIQIKKFISDELVYTWNISTISNDIEEIYNTADNKYCFILAGNFIYKMDLVKKKIIKQIEHEKYITDIKVTGDGKHVLALKENQVLLWDTTHSESFIPIFTHIEEISEFEISIDGRYLAFTGYGEDYFSVIDFIRYDILVDSEELSFETAFSKSFSNNEYIAYVRDDHLLISENNEFIKQFKFPLLVSDDNFSFDISADGSKMAYAIGDCRASILDFAGSKTYTTIAPHESQITSISISSDCKSIATADYGNRIILSDLKNGNHIATMQDFNSNKAMVVLFSPSSKLLASGVGNKIYIWNTNNYELISSINAHDSWITSLLFSQDEKILLSASEDKEIKAWNLEDFGCINVLKLKGSNLKICSIFQDNKILVANSRYKNHHALPINLYNFYKVPLTTIIRTWQFQNNSNGNWDSSYSYCCYHCESKIYDDDLIEKILLENYPGIKQKDNDKQDVRSIIRCGKCNKKLCLNTFIIN